MATRITCRVQNDDGDIIAVGCSGARYKMIDVWNDIKHRNAEYYTEEGGSRAKVYAREREGRKYLTTHPDTVTDNNLDELPNC